MRGNVYICLNTSTYNSKIPKELLASCGIPTFDEEGVLEEVIHPTFKELGAYNLQKFGSVPKIKIGSSNYYIIELELSWLNGEISSLIKLGKGLSFPKNALMNSSEAKEFIKDNTSEDI